MSSLANAEATSASGDKTTAGSFAVGLVFFVSGMPALVYQLIWQRALFTMYGINVEAVTVVVAGFLLGLGFGSLAGGHLSRRPSLNLLAVFGIIELAIGGIGIMSLRIVNFVGQATIHLPLGELTVVTLALLFVPTLFMGSTLPILSTYLVRRSRNVGKSVGLLYCVNTVGSATACFASAFFLMRMAGMQGAVTIAASINFLVGGVALAETWRNGKDGLPRSEPATQVSTKAPTRPSQVEMFFAVGVAALVGYVSLSYEIVWFRAFSIATNTSLAFALILGTYLAGIANGSWRVRGVFANSRMPGETLSVAATALLAASVLGFALLPAVAFSASSSFGYFYPMLLLVFVQTTITGMVFPIVCHYAISPDDQVGARVSWIYVANILGSVAGTLVTGFVLMNYLSIARISTFLGLIGVGIALLVAIKADASRGRRRAVLALGIAALVTMPMISGPMFKGFYDHLLANVLTGRAGEFVDIVENRSGVITVDEQSHVFGNGAYDGRIAIDFMHDENALIRPFALSLFHASPENVLMIGMATGAWAQVIAGNPGVKHLTVVEINPGYLELIKKSAVVAGLLRNPKVDIVIDDGRRWLNRHPQSKFDAIIQNTTWHYRPNVTNLLSREYLALVAAHLRDGGVVMYNTTGSVRVQRTACEAFPSGYRVFNVMVASPRPMLPDPARLRETLVNYRIDGRPVLDLADPKQRERLDEVLSLLTLPPPGAAQPDAFMEDCGGILARGRGAQIITDDNMGEEWFGLLMTDPLLRRFHGLN